MQILCSTKLYFENFLKRLSKNDLIDWELKRKTSIRKRIKQRFQSEQSLRTPKFAHVSATLL